MTKIDKIIEEISSLTIIESLDLVKKIEKKWNISSDKISILDKKENGKKKEGDKKSYKVMLYGIGIKKLSIIKEIKKITNKSLMESKKITDKLPSVIKEKTDTKEANEIKEKLEKLGAKIILK